MAIAPCICNCFANRINENAKSLKCTRINRTQSSAVLSRKLYLVESLQSHFILTMSHWSSGLPVCYPPQGTQVQIPRGYLCETGILLLALSRYNLLNHVPAPAIRKINLIINQWPICISTVTWELQGQYFSWPLETTYPGW